MFSTKLIFIALKFCSVVTNLNEDNQWRLVAFINGGASKIIIEMSKSSIRRPP